jgi:hypothetical protein
MSRPIPRAKQKSKSSPRTTAILILVGILFPLCMIEVATHLVPSIIPFEIQSVFQNEENQPVKGLVPDTDLGYKYAPNLANFPVPFEGDHAQRTYPVSTVSLGYAAAGFRDDGLNGQAHAVVIGDSYASCASVELADCWVELLEQASGQEYVNLGVVGYGPQQEQRMLAKYGLPLQPELVVWVFFANDLNDAWRFDQFGTGGVTEGKFWQNPVKAWLARNSTVYTLLSFFWYNRYLFYNLVRAGDQTIPRDTNLVWWLTYTDPAVPMVAEGLALTQEALLAASRQAERSGAGFAVVIIPYREQVYAAEAFQARMDRINGILVDFCQQHAIPVIDLTPALREKAAQEKSPIYFKKDIHLNPRGNQLVAELLGQSLESGQK